MADIETLDVDAVGTDIMDDATVDIDADPDSNNLSIAADAAYFSEGHTAVFPCTIRYIDLTALKLEYLPRVPTHDIHPGRVEDYDRFFLTREKKGIRLGGGVAFTGQPGIGGIP